MTSAPGMLATPRRAVRRDRSGWKTFKHQIGSVPGSMAQRAGTEGTHAWRADCDAPSSLDGARPYAVTVVAADEWLRGSLLNVWGVAYGRLCPCRRVGLAGTA